ncbi:laminin G, partial [Halobacteriales archaeon QH_9_66_26]
TITAGERTTTAGVNATTTAANDSRLLGGLTGGTLIFVFGLLLVILFGVAALVARRRDSRPETALDSDSK